MSARERLLGVISFTECANGGATPDALLDAYRDEILAEAAESLDNHRIAGLMDAVDNALLAYGFFNPANSAPETAKILAAVRRHLLAMRTAPSDRPCGCSVRWARHLDSCPTAPGRTDR